MLTKNPVSKSDGDCITDEHLGRRHHRQVGNVHLVKLWSPTDDRDDGGGDIEAMLPCETDQGVDHGDQRDGDADGERKINTG